jgi:hypothetical protein
MKFDVSKKVKKVEKSDFGLVKKSEKKSQKKSLFCAKKMVKFGSETQKNGT